MFVLKKLFVLLLAVTVIMTTACSRLKESEQAIENCGSEDISKIEEMYGAKTDNYKLVSGLQGKFNYVGSAQFGEVVFVADDNLYRMNSNGVSLISEHVNLNGNNFCYLNRNGEIVLVDQYDRNVTSYSEAGESFKIKLGKNQDRLICTDDLYYSFDDQKVVSSFNMFSDGSKRASTIINEVQRLPDGVSSDDFNIITAKSATRGIVPFYLSEKNELLAIDMIDTNNGILYIDEQFPAVCDVGEIYLWNASKNVSPLFSKVGNVRSLFLVNYGRDVESAIDDASVEFVLPNDFTIYNILPFASFSCIMTFSTSNGLESFVVIN